MFECNNLNIHSHWPHIHNTICLNRTERTGINIITSCYKGLSCLHDLFYQVVHNDVLWYNLQNTLNPFIKLTCVIISRLIYLFFTSMIKRFRKIRFKIKINILIKTHLSWYGMRETAVCVCVGGLYCNSRLSNYVF